MPLKYKKKAGEAVVELDNFKYTLSTYDTMVELDQFKYTLSTFEKPLVEVRDSL